LKYISALIGAYLIVGPIYVRRKLYGLLSKMPLNIMRFRREGGLGLLIGAAAGWPIATFINRDFGYWLFFTVVAAILLYLSSI
jgi:hypothetical protein